MDWQIAMLVAAAAIVWSLATAISATVPWQHRADAARYDAS